MANDKVNPEQWKIWKKNLMRFFLDREIANFYCYLDILEQPLNTKKQEVVKNIDLADNGLAVSIDSDSRDELIDLKVESEQLNGFSNLLRQSFLTTLYSFMELWILRECYLDSKHNNGGESYREFKKEKGIEKAKKYYLKYIQGSLSFDTNRDWLWIIKFRLLRDCIVHRQGSLSGFSDFNVNPTLKAFIQEENSLSLFGTDNNQIFVEHEFCIKAIRIVHSFMVEFLSLQKETV